jgi:hypothetical protein
MCDAPQGVCRYFTTYSGVRLPLKLTQELEESAIANRNTFFRGYFDAEGRMTGFQKVQYGEVELEHRYAYGSDGTLSHASIIDAEGEITALRFSENGAAILPES